jgi:hypothetical protein
MRIVSNIQRDHLGKIQSPLILKQVVHKTTAVFQSASGSSYTIAWETGVKIKVHNFFSKIEPVEIYL